MASTHEHDHGHGEHHGPTVNIYLAVFGALCVATLVSFVANVLMGQGNYTAATIIMVVAVFKATLVVMYFMHFKYDWPRLYFIVIPLMILTVMMVIVLLPDIVVTWHVNPDMTVGVSE